MITGRAIFSSLTGMLEAPEDLFSSSKSIIFINSPFVVCAIRKLVLIIYFRYVLGALCDLGIDCSVFGPIHVKKLLNGLDTSLGLVYHLQCYIFNLCWIHQFRSLVFTIFLILIHVFSCQFCNFQSNFDSILS